MNHESHTSKSRFAIVSTLIVVNVSMSINQGNIPASYSQINQDFNHGIIGLGLLSASFFLSYAIFEVPGGFLAVRFGPKKLICMGTAISAIAVVTSSFSPAFDDLIALRFLVGLGSALAYPSTLVLIVRHYNVTKSGFGMGLISLSSAIGSVLGLFAWAVLTDALGWRTSIFVGGLISSLALGLLVFAVPEDLTKQRTGFRFSHIRRIALDKVLTAVAIAFFGLAATSGLISSFMIYYMESRFQVSAGIAGGIVAVGFAIPMASGPLFGRLYDSIRNRKAMLLSASLAESLSISITSLGSFPSAVIASLTARSVSSGTSIVALATARHQVSATPEFESASIAWVDSFSLLGNFVGPIIFSFGASTYGYSLAWLLGGAIAILLALPVLAISQDSFIPKTS